MSLLHYGLNNQAKTLEKFFNFIFRRPSVFGGYAIDELVEKKDEKSYSNKILDIVDTLSHNPEEANLVGSLTYSIFKYGSDVDIFSNLEEFTDTKTQALAKFVKEIQKIVKKVLDNKLFFFSDFKAGKDERYEIDMTSKVKTQKQLLSLRNKKLLEPEDYNELMDLSNYLNILSKKEEFNGILKKYSVLRWTPKEIMKAAKYYRGKQFSLANCLGQPGIVKLDAITYLGGTRSAYIECSNFIIMKWNDKQGKEHYINVPEGKTLSEYLTSSIKSEMNALTNPKSSNFNLWKFAKRLYAVAAFHKDEPLLKQLAPLLTSSLAAMNQIAADCETLALMVDKMKHPPVKKMLEEIDNFKPRLASIQNKDLDKKLCYDIIDNILQAGKYNTLDGFNTQIEKLHDYLKDIIKRQASEYVTKKQLVQKAKKYLK